MHLHPKAARNGVMPYMHWLAKCADGVSIYLAGVITFWAYFGYPLWQWERYQWMTALSSLMGVFVLSGCGVYRSWRGALRAPLLLRLTQGFLYLAGMIAGYLYLTKAGHHFSRLWFGIWLGTAFALCIMSRLIAYWLLSRLRASGHNTRSLALILLAPLLLAVALWIRIRAGSPIFYRQARVGWNGEVFNILKFRTMPTGNEQDGATWGGAGEKPTIPMGRWLRRLSIDELPQFWNVLKGEMSVVGPRPERPQFVEQFKDEIPGYMQKHMVKAGITGWAQVNGWRGDTDLEERINYDLWYIENWSLWLDLKIIALTALRVFHDRNAQ